MSERAEELATEVFGLIREGGVIRLEDIRARVEQYGQEVREAAAKIPLTYTVRRATDTRVGLALRKTPSVTSQVYACAIREMPLP